MRKSLLAGIAALVVLAIAVPALAATKASTFKVAFSTKKEKASSGLKFDIKFSDKAAPVPKALTKFTLSLAKGSKFDVRGAAVCQITNAQLDTGTSTCPANTQVGKGTASAVPPGGGQKIDTTVKIFNVNPIPASGNKANGDLVFQFQIGGKDVVNFVAHLKGAKMTSQKLTGTLPGDVIVTDFKGTINKKNKGKRHLLTTPKTCPKSKKWVNKGTFSFDGGSVDKPKYKVACKQ